MGLDGLCSSLPCFWFSMEASLYSRGRDGGEWWAQILQSFCLLIFNFKSLDQWDIFPALLFLGIV